jgi:hypothetical protein
MNNDNERSATRGHDGKCSVNVSNRVDARSDESEVVLSFCCFEDESYVPESKGEHNGRAEFSKRFEDGTGFAPSLKSHTEVAEPS